MATTYDKIATTTLGSAAASITFSTIAASWTDLRLVLIASVDTYSPGWIRFNSDSGNNYSFTNLDGNGSYASSSQYSLYSKIVAGKSSLQISSNWSFYTLDIFSYTGSTYKTSLLSESADHNGYGDASVQVNLWQSTSAITSINLLLSGTQNYAAGTTATLYGIKAA